MKAPQISIGTDPASKQKGAGVFNLQDGIAEWLRKDESVPYPDLLRQLADYYPQQEKSGFFDLPTSNICRYPSHNPPSHLHIPFGKGYRHVCPSCGNAMTLIPPQITF